jgi:hypothetical protein
MKRHSMIFMRNILSPLSLRIGFTAYDYHGVVALKVLRKFA